MQLTVALDGRVLHSTDVREECDRLTAERAASAAIAAASIVLAGHGALVIDEGPRPS